MGRHILSVYHKLTTVLVKVLSLLDRSFESECWILIGSTSVVQTIFGQVRNQMSFLLEYRYGLGVS